MCTFLTVVLLFAGCQRVLHQRADGHGTHAARNGGDVGALGTDFVELHIAIKAETALTGGIRNTRGAHVNNDCTLFHHVGGHKVGLADGGDDDVGLTALLFQRLRSRVAHGDGSVAILLLHHELCHGLAYDVASAQDNTLLARGLNVITLQQC